jgi:uncharacterized protein HemY
MGNLYNRQHNYGEAERYYRRALPIFEKSDITECCEFVYFLESFAEACEQQGKRDEANSLRRRAEAIRAKRAARAGETPDRPGS